MLSTPSRAARSSRRWTGPPPSSKASCARKVGRRPNPSPALRERASPDQVRRRVRVFGYLLVAGADHDVAMACAGVALATLDRVALRRLDVLAVGAAPGLVAVALGQGAAAARLDGMHSALRGSAVFQRHLVGAGGGRLVLARPEGSGRMVVSNRAVSGLRRS